MKKLLLLLIICTTNVYAKDFPEALNNTKWKMLNVKNEKNYSTYEFSGNHLTHKAFVNNKLKNTYTLKMTDYHLIGELLFIWYEDTTNPDVFEMRYDLIDYGEVILLYYGFDTEDRDAWVNAFAPLEE